MKQQQLDEIARLIHEHNKPELAKEPGMVYQVWEDGEITMQKSGELLWQRSLHCIEPGYKVSAPLELFPKENTDGKGGKHSYVFTDKEGAEAIRKVISELPNEMVM